MGKHVVSVPFSSALAGRVFALVHPGGLLATPAQILHLDVDGPQDVAVRVKISRFSSKASGGSLVASAPFADGASAASCEVRTGGVSYPAGDPAMSVMALCRTRGPCTTVDLFGSGSFTLAPNRTLVLETLDAVPSSTSFPLTFKLIWDE